jgi:plasmid stabilization system protein ParE
MELVIAPSARVDLLSIWEYASRRDIYKANELLNSFKEAFDLLVTFPEMGREPEGSPSRHTQFFAQRLFPYQ